jgi:hypothetical protein
MPFKHKKVYYTRSSYRVVGTKKTSVLVALFEVLLNLNVFHKILILVGNKFFTLYTPVARTILLKIFVL